MMDIREFVKVNKISGAIFDMDGTLTDSMGKWNEIYKILSDCLCVKLPPEFLMKYNHLSMKSCAQMIINNFNLNVDSQTVYEKWLYATVKYYENVFKIKPYMLATVKELNSIGIKMAVATASDKQCAEAFINSNDLTEYISSVISLDEVSRPKSFPDIYMKAADKIGVEPSECIVFEDALTAIKAAKNGGFKVCGVQDDSSKDDEEKIKTATDFILGFYA